MEISTIHLTIAIWLLQIWITFKITKAKTVTILFTGIILTIYKLSYIYQ